MKRNDLNHIIKTFNLMAHPEGGYFSETYRSEVRLESENDKNIQKSIGTSIYYLLDKDQISHFHKLSSDEIWYYHTGSSIILHLIEPNGNYKKVKLGKNILKGELPSFIVRKEVWMAAELKNKKSFGFVSCVVMPGFEFSDFTLAKKEDLLKICPSQKKKIKRFTFEQN